VTFVKGRVAASRMNKLEADFEQTFLMGLPHGFEELTFRLGGDCRYTPDFWVMEGDGVLALVECKGFWRDDAKAKLRVAAERYPNFRWKAFRKLPKSQGGLWQMERFGQEDAA
jgi:hypothetical protein